MRIDDQTDGSNIDARIDRSFSASPDLVFKQWITAENLSLWFAPSGFAVTLAEADPVEGGRWQVEMRSDKGEVYLEYGDYREIDSPRKLVFSLTSVLGSEVGPRTMVTVGLAGDGNRTAMAFLQEGFETVERRDDNVRGWNECFDKLEAIVVPRGKTFR
jgi:uncharacterized protein YndB with AHSA1/START domain